MMTRILFNSLFVAATVFACLPTYSAAQQTSSTDVLKATSPTIDDLDPSLIESELINESQVSKDPAPLKTAANISNKRGSIQRPSQSVQTRTIDQNNFPSQFQTDTVQTGSGKPIVDRIEIGQKDFSREVNHQTQQTPTTQPVPNLFGNEVVGIGNQQPVTALPVNNGTMLERRIAPAIQTQIMAPKSINVNQPAQIFIQAHNIGQAMVKTVKLIAEIPEHANFESSIPLPTNVNGQFYEFTLNNLDAQAKQIVKINLVPTAKLPLNIATQTKIESQQQFAVSVKQPVLDISVSGPEAIQTGQTVSHTVTVKNIGDGPAENIRIKPMLPESLQFASNQKTLVPKLTPGQSAKFVLSSYATSAGESNVIFQVSASGIESREGGSNLRIVRPELGVQILGPSQNFLGRDGVYSIQLENASELPIKEVDITLRVPSGLNVNTISQQAEINNVAGTLKWQFTNIAGGKQETIQFKAKAIKTGNQSLDVMVTSKEIGSKQLELTTTVQGRADLSIRMSDGGEPVGIGSKSEFTIEVANHGSTIAKGVNVQIQLPPALMAVNQEQYTIDSSGNFIQFNELDVAPGKTKIFKFKVVAVNEGEHVVRGSVSIQGSSQTISTENSIFVFESQNAKVSEALTPAVRR